jgi:hypothetical protein
LIVELLAEVESDLLQHGPQLPGPLAGLNERQIRRIEVLGMLGQRRREIFTCLDVLFKTCQNFFQSGVFFLFVQALQRRGEINSSLDHDGQLAGEIHDFRLFHSSGEEIEPIIFFGDLDHLKAVSAELLHNLFAARAVQRAFMLVTKRIANCVRK